MSRYLTPIIKPIVVIPTRFLPELGEVGIGEKMQLTLFVSVKEISENEYAFEVSSAQVETFKKLKGKPR